MLLIQTDKNNKRKQEKKKKLAVGWE